MVYVVITLCVVAAGLVGYTFGSLRTGLWQPDPNATIQYLGGQLSNLSEKLMAMVASAYSKETRSLAGGLASGSQNDTLRRLLRQVDLEKTLLVQDAERERAPQPVGKSDGSELE